MERSSRRSNIGVQMIGTSSKKIISTVIFGIVLTGCAPTITILGERGNKELTKNITSELKVDPKSAVTKVSQDQLFYKIGVEALLQTCDAAYEMRDYRHFAECVAHYPKYHYKSKEWEWEKLRNPFFDFTEHAPLFVQAGSINLRGKLAIAKVELGQLEQAINIGNEVISALTPTSSHQPNIQIRKPDYDILTYEGLIDAYNALGLSYAIKGDSNKAMEMVEAIDKMDLFCGGPMMKKKKHSAMASILMSLGNFNEAKEVIDRYDNITVEDAGCGVLLGILTGGGGALIMMAAQAGVGATTLLITGATYQDVVKDYVAAKVDMETDDLESARKKFDKLLKKKVLIAKSNLHFRALYDRGVIALHDKDLTEAIRLFKKSVDEIEVQRSTINSEVSKIGFFGSKQKVYSDLIDTLVTVGNIEEAFSYVERAKARALIDLLAQRQNLKSREQDPAVLEAMLKELRNQEEKSLLRTAETNFAANRGVLLSARNKIIKTAPEFASLVTVNSSSTREIQSLIRRDETLVEFYGQSDDLFVFVVTNNSINAVKLDSKGLADAVGRYRATMEQNR